MCSIQMVRLKYCFAGGDVVKETPVYRQVRTHTDTHAVKDFSTEVLKSSCKVKGIRQVVFPIFGIYVISSNREIPKRLINLTLQWFSGEYYKGTVFRN